MTANIYIMASNQNKKLEYDLGLRTTIDLWPTLLKFFSEFSDPGLLLPRPKIVSTIVKSFDGLGGGELTDFGKSKEKKY